MTFCQPDPIQQDAKCQNPVGFSACYTRKGCSLLMTRHRIKVCVVLLFSTLLQISTLMEFSKILGCTEEYSGASGSESGWTNYIASPIKENDFDDKNADSKNKQGDCRIGNYGNDGGGGESDDSMTSDASSGPSHPELPCRGNEGSVKIGPSKYATSKYSSKAKRQKQVKETDGSARIRVEKEVSVLKENSAASYVRSRTKNSTVKLDLSISLPFSRKVKYMHEDFTTSSSWKNEIPGMHPDTLHESGRVPGTRFKYSTLVSFKLSSQALMAKGHVTTLKPTNQIYIGLKEEGIRPGIDHLLCNSYEDLIKQSLDPWDFKSI
ncbi:hypothetical protein SADUNF_Sadunf10G0100800 [Salix dunnii]|uniref:Uncharacterized protein n=1 Tax=Salix dunnii TaxID=1413687 RepID=A0A835MUQ9_9ROSI|nr:hypothetical protein SADUNF_Sadunf10G0100800 [Salix dunnii]